MDLTLEEKVSGAEQHARQQAAEMHFFDLSMSRGFVPRGFSVEWRNPGHWDVCARQVPGKASAWKHANPGGFSNISDKAEERAFCIRGEAGNVTVYDERWDPHRPHPRPVLTFRSVLAAMLWIAEEMMQETALTPNT